MLTLLSTIQSGNFTLKLVISDDPDISVSGLFITNGGQCSYQSGYFINGTWTGYDDTIMYGKRCSISVSGFLNNYSIESSDINGDTSYTITASSSKLPTSILSIRGWVSSGYLEYGERAGFMNTWYGNLSTVPHPSDFQPICNVTLQQTFKYTAFDTINGLTYFKDCSLMPNGSLTVPFMWTEQYNILTPPDFKIIFIDQDKKLLSTGFVFVVKDQSQNIIISGKSNYVGSIINSQWPIYIEWSSSQYAIIQKDFVNSYVQRLDHWLRFQSVVYSVQKYQTQIIALEVEGYNQPLTGIAFTHGCQKTPWVQELHFINSVLTWHVSAIETLCESDFLYDVVNIDESYSVNFTTFPATRTIYISGQKASDLISYAKTVTAFVSIAYDNMQLGLVLSIENIVHPFIVSPTFITNQNIVGGDEITYTTGIQAKQCNVNNNKIINCTIAELIISKWAPASDWKTQAPQNVNIRFVSENGTNITDSIQLSIRDGTGYQIKDINTMQQLHYIARYVNETKFPIRVTIISGLYSSQLATNIFTASQLPINKTIILKETVNGGSGYRTCEFMLSFLTYTGGYSLTCPVDAVCIDPSISITELVGLFSPKPDFQSILQKLASFMLCLFLPIERISPCPPQTELTQIPTNFRTVTFSIIGDLSDTIGGYRKDIEIISFLSGVVKYCKHNGPPTGIRLCEYTLTLDIYVGTISGGYSITCPATAMCTQPAISMKQIIEIISSPTLTEIEDFLEQLTLCGMSITPVTCPDGSTHDIVPPDFTSTVFGLTGTLSKYVPFKYTIGFQKMNTLGLLRFCRRTMASDQQVKSCSIALTSQFGYAFTCPQDAWCGKPTLSTSEITDLINAPSYDKLISFINKLTLCIFVNPLCQTGTIAQILPSGFETTRIGTITMLNKYLNPFTYEISISNTIGLLGSIKYCKILTALPTIVKFVFAFVGLTYTNPLIVTLGSSICNQSYTGWNYICQDDGKLFQSPMILSVSDSNGQIQQKQIQVDFKENIENPDQLIEVQKVSKPTSVIISFKSQSLDYISGTLTVSLGCYPCLKSGSSYKYICIDIEQKFTSTMQLIVRDSASKVQTIEQNLIMQLNSDNVQDVPVTLVQGSTPTTVRLHFQIGTSSFTSALLIVVLDSSNCTRDPMGYDYYCTDNGLTFITPMSVSVIDNSNTVKNISKSISFVLHQSSTVNIDLELVVVESKKTTIVIHFMINGQDSTLSGLSVIIGGITCIGSTNNYDYVCIDDGTIFDNLIVLSVTDPKNDISPLTQSLSITPLITNTKTISVTLFTAVIFMFNVNSTQYTTNLDVKLGDRQCELCSLGFLCKDIANSFIDQMLLTVTDTTGVVVNMTQQVSLILHSRNTINIDLVQYTIIQVKVIGSALAVFQVTIQDQIPKIVENVYQFSINDYNGLLEAKIIDTTGRYQNSTWPILDVIRYGFNKITIEPVKNTVYSVSIPDKNGVAADLNIWLELGGVKVQGVYQATAFKFQKQAGGSSTYIFINTSATPISPKMVLHINSVYYEDPAVSLDVNMNIDTIPAIISIIDKVIPIPIIPTGSNIGLIVGTSIGAVFVIVLIIVIMLVQKRKKQRKIPAKGVEMRVATDGSIKYEAKDIVQVQKANETVIPTLEVNINQIIKFEVVIPNIKEHTDQVFV